MPPTVSNDADDGITRPIAVPGRQNNGLGLNYERDTSIESCDSQARRLHSNIPSNKQNDLVDDRFELYYDRPFNNHGINNNHMHNTATSTAAAAVEDGGGLKIKKTRSRQKTPYMNQGSSSSSRSNSPKSSTATLLMPKHSKNTSAYLESGIHDEYVPDFASNSSAVGAETPNQHLHCNTITGTARPEQSLASGEYLPTDEVLGLNNGNRRSSIGSISSEQSSSFTNMNDASSTSRFPRKQQQSLEAAAAILASPTLGLSESEWKAIPFSTRRKLRNNIEQASAELLPSSFQMAPNSTNSSRVSLNSMGGTSPLSRHMSLDQRQSIPFTSRMRDRSFTINPDTSVLANLRKGANIMNNTSTGTSSVSRSASLSTSPLSFSPAYQYLSRFGVGPSSSSSPTASDTGETIGNYAIGKLIGYGTFSQVREAVTMEHDKKVVRAVKIVKKHSSSTSREKMEQIQQEFTHEVSLWKQLNHTHILHLLSVEEDDNAIYCFTDKITGGTLLDYVKHTKHKLLSYKPASPDYKRRIRHLLPTTLVYLKQMADALIYLHETMFIVHRDLKLENCLLEETEPGTYKVLICDFGMSDYYEPPSPIDDPSSLKPASVDSINSANSNSGSSLSSMRSDGSANHLLIGPSETSSVIKRAARRRSSTSSTSSGDADFPTHLTQDSMDVDDENNSLALSRASSRPSSSVSISLATSTNNCGSLPYASPQLLTSNFPIVQPHVDIWAFGVVMYAMLMGKLPWMHGFAPRLRLMILQNKWKDMDMESIYGCELTDIVRGCLRVDVSQRFDTRKVKDSLWVIKLDPEL